MHRPEDLLDAHPIVEDAVEHGFTDLVVVQGAGFHARGSGAEGRATVAPGPVFAVGDVEVDDLLVGDGTDLTVKNILALTQLATSGAWGLARGAFQGYGSNVGIVHLHDLRAPGDLVGEPYLAWFKSWVLQVTVRTVPVPRRWRFFLSPDR